jgi:hypothetical protein
LLEECVAWFLLQDYEGPKELLILNDCKEQILECDAPGVRVINTAERSPTLGDKYNLMNDLATGEIVLPWEDDDVSLPNRIRQCVENLGECEYYNPQHTWYEQNGQLFKTHQHGVCHNASAYRRGKINYPSVNGSQDAGADFQAKCLLKCSSIVLDRPHQWDYVYRFGVSNYHLSGFADMDKAYLNQSPTPGRFCIVPRVYRDYVAETSQLLCGGCSLREPCCCRKFGPTLSTTFVEVIQ